MKSYDLAIIGSGPGGYVAGLYASRKKISVCVIEKDTLGGTCLNRGCIPTKSLLNSVSIISRIRSAPSCGVSVEGYKIDFGKMMARKNEVVLRLRTGIETLFRANKIDLIKGSARLKTSDTIEIEGHEPVKARHIIIAAGSRVMDLPGISIDETDILSSDGILSINSIPRSLAVIGGGVIGCELANLFNSLGAKVTIVEMMDRLIPGQSREVSKKLEMIFKKSGIDVFTSSKTEAIGKGGILRLAVSGGKTVEAEKVLVSVGRRSNTEGLGLEGLGIEVQNGKIGVDNFLKTGVGGIYAIGDCVAGPLLAHRASYDGIVACDNILGKAGTVDYSNIPSCIWTEPEIASVGMCEEEARAKYADARVAKFPYLASGKAYLEGEIEGFAKIIGTSDGRLLGVEVFGKDACNLIGEATLAKTAGVSIEEWARVVHGHPTLSEIFQEASGVFCGTAIHSV